MSDELRSVLVGTAGLDVALLAAVALVLARPAAHGAPEALRRSRRLALLAVGAQGVHFAEELLTGFGTRFPALLGLPAWPRAFFVGFNLAWLAAFGLAAATLRAGSRVALVPLWFLAIAGVANGVAHPAAALRAGGYFPGLVTAPLVGALGLLLGARLSTLTRSPAPPRS